VLGEPDPYIFDPALIIQKKADWHAKATPGDPYLGGNRATRAEAVELRDAINHTYGWLCVAYIQ
jgi:hypothetical protein